MARRKEKEFDVMDYALVAGLLSVALSTIPFASILEAAKSFF